MQHNVSKNRPKKFVTRAGRTISDAPQYLEFGETVIMAAGVAAFTILAGLGAGYAYLLLWGV